MPITALPTPPSRQDPANFAARGDALLGALPVFVSEANALAADVTSKEASAVSSASTASTAATAATAKEALATAAAETAVEKADIAVAAAAAAQTSGSAVALQNTLASSAGAANIGYMPGGTGAVATDVQSKLRESISVEDYPTHAAYVAASSDGGFFRDDATPGRETRVRDRMFVGDAAKYTGNRLGANGYGSSWTTSKGASYLIKNATMAVSAVDTGTYATDRYGIVGFSKRMGVGAVCVNDGADTFARGLYAEAFHSGSGSAASAGVEVVVGNYTATTPSANAYNVSNIVTTALMINVNGGAGYTVGDADTPITVATQPSGCGIDISGYAPGTNQSFVVGINIRDSGLYRDGSGFGVAMSMAQKHRLNWEISASETGASVWSEVVDPLQKVGLKFENRSVTMVGMNSRTILKSTDDLSGAGAVNYPVVKNSRTGIAVSFGAEGTDAVISTDIYSKSTGAVRLMSHGGTGENLRIVPPASAPTDYLTIAGSTGGTIATIGTAGASSNIDIRFLPKGTGVMRFGAFAASGDVAINGYVTIKTDDGVTRKLATVA